MSNKRLETQVLFPNTWVMAVAGGVLAAGLAIAAFGAAKAGDAAPAGQDANAAAENGDPLEHVNRFTSDVNRALRGAVIDPLVDGYQAVTPQPVQNSVSNVFSNFSEPVTAVSSLLQGDTENAGNATNRFFVNTTLGLGGLQDPATDMGYEQRREDLGQAMAVNGVESGPHIVLPILGPSNFRDATGDILTGLASPLPLAIHAAGSGVTYSQHQEDIQAIGNGAVDPYIAEREAYEQHRDYLVNNGFELDDNFPAFADNDGASVANRQD